MKGVVFRSCPNNISINSHKKHGRWNEKMAETGQEEGYVLDLKWMSIIHTYFCAIVYKIGHPLYVKNRCISYIHWTSIVVFAALVWTSIGRNEIYI
ncbi:hypothetical protein NQ317_007349 [Molorchus minor]|uniref:Uncharacterized protein n=1 Tax=Molorchus minor TaxID=1323400 RepID=A0ABQ9ISS5_9CUCU|nr:hypothetical protein NQ317_007349 [Molorchus minor]